MVFHHGLSFLQPGHIADHDVGGRGDGGQAGGLARGGRGGKRVGQVGMSARQTGGPYSVPLRWTMAS